MLEIYNVNKHNKTFDTIFKIVIDYINKEKETRRRTIMNKKTGATLGITGGILAIIVASLLFAVTVGGIGIGGSGIVYAVPTVFGISDPETIMSGYCGLIMIFGAMGIAGGVYAGKNNQLSATLMVIPGIGGFLLLSVMWIPIATMLIPGGILTLRSEY